MEIGSRHVDDREFFCKRHRVEYLASEGAGGDAEHPQNEIGGALRGTFDGRFAGGSPSRPSFSTWAPSPSRRSLTRRRLLT